MYILCYTIQAIIILGIFFKGTSNRFIINLHLSFKSQMPSLRTSSSKIVWNFNLSLSRISLFFHPWMDNTSKVLPDIQLLLSTCMAGNSLNVSTSNFCHLKYCPIVKTSCPSKFIILKHTIWSNNSLQNRWIKWLPTIIILSTNYKSQNKIMWSIYRHLWCKVFRASV